METLMKNWVFDFILRSLDVLCEKLSQRAIWLYFTVFIWARFGPRKRKTQRPGGGVGGLERSSCKSLLKVTAVDLARVARRRPLARNDFLVGAAALSPPPTSDGKV